ncbi:hypothetical protein EYF80_026351 [Liparis tanakae]|uniref:Uncharacterized protein n=1 Tax=Liparis tanakae TaxID=230148 RepID=A0A4Z2HDQ5_9TELE|nr:hypothetical protein EYF80_026351 [Liparis tanakae]
MELNDDDVAAWGGRGVEVEELHDRDIQTWGVEEEGEVEDGGDKDDDKDDEEEEAAGKPRGRKGLYLQSPAARDRANSNQPGEGISALRARHEQTEDGAATKQVLRAEVAVVLGGRNKMLADPSAAGEVVACLAECGTITVCAWCEGVKFQTHEGLTRLIAGEGRNTWVESTVDLV